MELPEFDAPDPKSPQKPPEVAVVGVGQAAAAPPAAEPPSPRRMLLSVFLPVLFVGLFFYFRWSSRPAPVDLTPSDPAATQDGRLLVRRREAERVNEKHVLVKTLLARARKVHGGTRDVKNLEFAMTQAEGLMRLQAFDKADAALEQIKRAIPAVPVNNPLEAAPKPIDVKAPPKATNEDPTPVAPASAQRPGAVRPNAPTPPSTTTAPAKKKPVRRRRR